MPQPELARLSHFAFVSQWRTFCLCMLGLALCMSGAELAGQNAARQDTAWQNNTAVLTLHVATNLVRIPVLVLTPAHERLSAPVAPNRFSIQFGGEPPFRPKYVRREGDDPINLAFVVDARRPQEALLPKLDEAIANLAPSYLRAGDRISIYAIDCSKTTAVENVPADRVQLKDAVDVALSSWTERQRLRSKLPCNLNTRLWDELAYVTKRLSTQSGWRAIVAVTNGDDRKSKRSLDDLVLEAQTSQVAILGLDPNQEDHHGMFVTDTRVVQLAKVCESSGGLRLDLYESTVAKRMQEFTQMLRDRYILEFPRPPTLKGGYTPMSVGIDRSNAFIRAAGDGIPLSDEALVGESTAIAATSTVAPPGVGSPASASLATEVVKEAPPASQTSAEVPTAASQPETPAHAPPGISTPLFKASTRLAVEDVTVTDGRNMPVRGLMQPNFTVKEDGKPQAIRNFEEYGTERPADESAPAQQTANVYSNARRPVPTTSAVNVILLDDVNTGGLGNRLAKTPENVVYAKQKSMKYLGNMPPGTEIAILQMGGALKVLQDFTSDKAVLLAAMKSAAYRPVDGAYVDEPRDEAEVCAAANLRSEFTVNALIQAAAFLSGIKGRKNLLWFTPGTPWLFEYPAFTEVKCFRDYTQQLHKAYALLNAAEVAVYPIDPRGLSGSPAQSADFQPNLNPQGAGAMQQAAFGGNKVAEHNALRDIADATGGVAYYNRNDLDAAIGEAIQTGDDYYSLSYVPPLSKYDGKYHTIEVKVDRPNLHLGYRAGYTSVDPATLPETPESSATQAALSPERELLAAMGHGDANSTQLLFQVRVSPSAAPAKPGDPEVIGTLSPSLKRRSLVRYDFSCSIAPDQITLLEDPDGTRKGSVELIFAAYDGAGQMLNVISETLKITLGPNEVAEFMQQPVQVPLKFDLPSGEIFVRLGVMDVASEKLGTLEIPEKVAK